jgi:HK97 family phage portal protein
VNAIQRFLSNFMPKSELTTLRSPATWFLDALFGQKEASSGVRVSEAVALGLSAYYCGVNMIAGTVGSLPLNVYKRDGKKREVAETHPAHRLLHTEPNPEMTAMSMRQSWIMHAIGRGNAYGEILWDDRGNPEQIWLLPPTITRPVRDDEGKLWYEVLPWEREVRYLEPENVLHIPSLGYDGLCGYGLIQLARESIGLNAGQDQYAGKFFRNGGNISGVIETEKTLTDPQFDKLKNEVATKLSGLTNAHRVAILEHGFKWKDINPTHEEAQLVDSRRFTVEEWARWLNMPPHKLKEMTHATFSNIEHQNIEWVVDTIRPWLIRFEQEFNRKLFRKQSVFYTKHVVDGLLRGDQKSRNDAYAVGRQWGWFSANDILELEDRNPLPGKQGDMYLVPANMIPADMAGKDVSKPPPGAPGDDQTGTAARNLAKSAAERVVRYEARQLESNGVAAYVEVGKRVVEWLCVSQEVADRYCSAAMQLNLIAEDKGITQDELKMRKVDLLVSLVLGGGNAAIQ